MPARQRLASVLIGLPLVAACTLGGSPAATSGQERDCGTEAQGPAVALDVDGRRCLLEAYLNGEPAIFLSAMTTMEGDPITRTYRVTADGELQIEHDARRDRFGSGRIELLRCDALVPVDQWNEARPNEPYAAEWVFVEDGCEVVGTR